MATFSFVTGNSYSSGNSSSPTTITQYSPAGSVVGSLTLPTALGTEVRGLSFGSDGYLYATEVVGSGFNVVALNSSGAVHQTYTMPNVYAAGSVAFGGIAMDSQYIYVAAQNQLTRFTLGNSSSGVSIYTNNQIYDTNVLPNGNLLVASAYQIQEITTSGTVVRTITPSVSLGDVRGIQYVAATNKLYVTMLGYTGYQFQLMRLDATTGALEKNVSFNYADDLSLDLSGNLVVGSWTQAPEVFDQNLNLIRTLGTSPELFVTVDTLPVPEPGTALVGLALCGVGVLRRRRIV